MIDAHDRARLDALYERMRAANEVSLGYPSAKDFDYSELDRFLRFPVNNIGDPFADGTYRVETREFEREVVQFFADLFRAPRDDWWGYVTNGGTEGNLPRTRTAPERHGLLFGADAL